MGAFSRRHLMYAIGVTSPRGDPLEHHWHALQFTLQGEGCIPPEAALVGTGDAMDGLVKN